MECLQRALMLDMPQQQQQLQLSPLSSPVPSATASPSYDFLGSSSLGLTASLGFGQQEQLQLPSALTAQRFWSNDGSMPDAFPEVGACYAMVLCNDSNEACR